MTRLVALALAIIASGCDCTADVPGQRGAQCDLNSDCDAPLVCRLELCRVECATTRDCAAGLQCVLDADGFGACQLPEETRCSRASDCPDPLVCANRRCVNMCAMDRDCPPGGRCIEGGCVDDSVEACVRDSDCSPVDGEPRVCGTDLRCRRGCYSSRECRLGTECAPDYICRRRCTVGAADCTGLGACVEILMSGTFWCDSRIDGGVPFDAGPAFDGGPIADVGPGIDVGPGASDAGPEIDSGPVDAGPMSCPPVSTAVSIATGEDDSCAVVASGEVYCWGDNFYYELGSLTPTRVNPRPRPVTGVTNAMRVVAGHDHFCALIRDGRVYCWGQNLSRQLGDPSIPAMPSLPVEVPGFVASTAAGSLSAGYGHTCAIEAGSGRVFCWGSGLNGALGDGSGSIHYAMSPQLVPGLAAGIDWVSVGQQNSFAFDGAALFAWGENNQGELGLGSMTAMLSPTAVMFTPVLFDSGHGHSCATDIGGRVWCWGGDYSGELGDGTVGMPTIQPMPQVVAGIAGPRLLDTGFEYTCIAEATGARCWGDNFDGQLGNGTTTDVIAASSSTPVVGLPAGARVDELATANRHACARIRGDVWCWGHNFAGELGFDPVPGSPAATCPFGPACIHPTAARVPCLP